MGTYGLAWSTQFHYAIGELNEDWNANIWFVMYFLIFMLVVFFLMLNFFLSIVVEVPARCTVSQHLTPEPPGSVAPSNRQ